MKIKQFEATASIVGAVVLFLSWGIQQLLFEGWNSSLARISASEAVFHSYRASDGVFRALAEVAPQDKQPEVERQQQIAYEKGLQVLALAVDSKVYAAERQRGEQTLDDGMTLGDLSTRARIMVEFDAIQRTLNAERVRLSNRKEAAATVFLSLYALGTLCLIGAGVARLLDLRNPAPEIMTPNLSLQRIAAPPTELER